MTTVLLPEVVEKRLASPVIDEDSLPGIAVIPYVKGRLAFAQLASLALASLRFDQVLLDLPEFFNHWEFARALSEAFPLPFLFVLATGERERTTWTFTASDAPTVALLLAIRQGRRWRCIDDEDLPRYPRGCLFEPSRQEQDDGFVLRDGPTAFFSRRWTELDRAWSKLGATERAFTLRRSTVVAHRLGRTVSPNSRTLFLCESTLWWAVRRVLRGDDCPSSEPGVFPLGQADAAFFWEDPLAAWTRGLLDDYPLIVQRFADDVLRENPSNIDKRTLVDEAVVEFLSEPQSPSIRRTAGFRRYLAVRLAAASRLTPLPATHLFEGARSFFGPEMARALAERMLGFCSPPQDPLRPPESFFRVSKTDFARGGAPFDFVGSLEAVAGEMGTEVPTDELGLRSLWAQRVRPFFTRAEHARLEKMPHGISWAVKEDFRFHFAACAQVREAARRGGTRVRAEKALGTCGAGIHWGATIAAIGHGERGIYVRRPVRRRFFGAQFDVFTPVVLLLSERDDRGAEFSVADGNMAQRRRWLGEMGENGEGEDPDHVYSVFARCSRGSGMLDGHIEIRRIEGIAFLYSGHVMGPERYAALAALEPAQQCRVDPTGDPDLASFSPNARLVAWAAKYAKGGVVVVVAPEDWVPDPALGLVVEERGARILRLPLSTFSGDLVARLGRMYFTSTPLKRHPQSEAIVCRVLH